MFGAPQWPRKIRVSQLVEQEKSRPVQPELALISQVTKVATRAAVEQNQSKGEIRTMASSKPSGGAGNKPGGPAGGKPAKPNTGGPGMGGNGSGGKKK